MQFESKMRRTFWFDTVISSIPDIIVVSAVTIYFKEDSLFLLFVFIGLQALYLLLWIKNSIWEWIVFFLLVRRRLKMYFFDGLKQDKWPEPNELVHSADDYFGAIVNDKSQPIELRLKASRELGTLSSLIIKGLQQSIRINMAFKDAIVEYKRISSSA